jgi:hypothetical protein
MENPTNRIWPGTVHFIDNVEWILLEAVRRRAAQEAADDLIASGPRELLGDK